MTRQIIYDVAVSADGFIADANGSTDGFLFEGDHVEAYQARLAQYDTVLMGRSTYEAGYAFGMKPGDFPYPAMRHYIFSKSLMLPSESELCVVRSPDRQLIRTLKSSNGGPIYLCGGGILAGWLLEAGLIDIVILKINPVSLGNGKSLFQTGRARLNLLETTPYRSGVILAKYAVDRRPICRST